MTYEKLDKCPVCSKTEFRNKLVVEDRTVSHESFAVVECASCGFQFTNPRPDPDNIGRYYESAAYVSHNSGAAGLVNQVYRLARVFTMRSKVRLLGRYAPQQGRVLDYGCGTGHFLAAARGAGWQVAGLEPNATARAEAAQRVGQPIGSPDNLAALAEGSFDAITLWHVLEHVHALNETLAHLVQLLRPGGVLLIAVPNAASFDAQYYGAQWAAYDVPRHLYHFVPSTMAQLLKKHRLVLRATLPMPLDAYYVSLLSEPTPGGAGRLLRALRLGYASNRAAAQHGGQYSSLLYVAGRA